ncbi:MAG: response regulator transcription factor [Caldilineaceae bacterium]|nr:response regulator transcription factor [Caldilineaceae bacterium]MDE0078695.1 response regulator transcription factor [Caldilineaceae bacterium]MDE0310879.1 response regulator transcription factor [Caldilineaceae bacterium]
MTTILVVDDDRLMRRSVSIGLRDAGYSTETAGSGEEALAKAREVEPQLVLLDIGLPGIDGLETLRALRQSFDAPIIFVTARRRELDEIVGLELGADDYVTKPFDIDVLLARVRAVLRRAAARGEPSSGVDLSNLIVGDLELDRSAHQVTLGGKTVELTPREFQLLAYLASRAGEVVPLDDILKNVWGTDWVGESQTVYVHVRWLRTKIEEDAARPRRIHTVRGVGYRLTPAGKDSSDVA